MRQLCNRRVAPIPWGHNVRILDLVKGVEQRLWYIEQAIQMLLQMLQEEPDRVRRDVNNGEFVNFFLNMYDPTIR
jgi:hypothetical protein